MDEKVKRCMILFFIFMVHAQQIDAHPLLELADTFMNNKEYYHAITECMRYQFLFPDGKEYPQSMLIMSRAYFLGGNYYRATDIAYDCYKKYTGTMYGDSALYNLAVMRLMEGSPFFAYRTYQEYFSIYPDGKYRETARLDFIYAQILLNNIHDAKNNVDAFIKQTSDEELRNEAMACLQLLHDYEKRPQKNIWVSATGSLLVPGFGHFYAGKYTVGVLSFVSTTLCAALAYRGYTHDNNFQLIFFGLAGFTFYQYSLVSAVLNVGEYNSNSINQLKKAIHITVQKRF